MRNPFSLRMCYALMFVISIGAVSVISATAADLPPSVSARANEALGLTASTVVDLQLPGVAQRAFQTRVPIGGQLVTLDLSPHSVRAPNYKLLAQIADGSIIEVDPGPSRTYRGTVREIPGSVVAGSLLDDGLHARILLPDDEYWVEPIAAKVPGAVRSQHAVYKRKDVIDPGATCGNHEGLASAASPFTPPRIDGAKSGDGPDGSLESHGTPTVTELANDADVEYYQDHGSSVTQVQNDIAALTNTMNLQYERDADLTHVITTTLVRTAEPDPFTATHSRTLLIEFQTEWNNNQGGITRDVAQLFTGKNLDSTTIGEAFDFGVICHATDGYCQVESDFTANMACKTDLSAHELGHCWNARHCSCSGFTMNASITCANVFNPVDSIPTIVGHRSLATCLTNNHPAPANDTCGTAEVTGPAEISATTAAADNTATGSCIGAATGAPDVWYSYTPTNSGPVTVDTCGTVYDTTLSIYDSCGGTELVCNDDSDACGTGSRQSSLTFSVSAGVTYFVRVFGWQQQAGDFSLSIACNNNDNCDPGEDCNNCPNDCREKTNGSPASRYCCDGDLPDCGNTACSEGGFNCDSPCMDDPECDDSDPCNGAETCVSGECQAGTPPGCQNGDGCCPSGCTPANDDDCDSCINPGGLPIGASCTDDVDCCADKCKGPSGGKTCK